MKLSKQCAPEYQSLICPKKRASEAKDFGTTSSVSCPSPRPRLPRPRLVASNFCGLKGMPAFWQCILEALCSWHFCWCENGRGQNWKKQKKALKSHNFWRNSRLRGGGSTSLAITSTDFCWPTFFQKKKVLVHHRLCHLILGREGLELNFHRGLEDGRMGMGDIPPEKIGNPFDGYIKPYYSVDDHPLLYGNKKSYKHRIVAFTST